MDFKSGIAQIPKAIDAILKTPVFIQKHKLWKGFWDQKSIFLFSIVISLLFSYLLYSDIYEYFHPDQFKEQSLDISVGEPEIEEDLASIQIENINEAIEVNAEPDQEELSEKEKDHKPLFSGGIKFLLLLLLEVLVFHFSVKTNNILKKENHHITLKEFYQAQLRMLKILGRKWVYSLLMYILVSILLGIAGLSSLKPLLMFFIYSYFLGFAFLANYLEQFHFTINESAIITKDHFGASIVFGIAWSGLLHIPILGPFFSPILCSIAAARYGHYNQIEIWSPEQKM